MKKLSQPELPRNFKYYDLITAIFVAVLLITQTTAGKIASFGPLALSAGILLFPVSYIFGDVLTEVYGFKRSRRVIWIGFLCSVLMAVVYGIVSILPPAPGFEHNQAYSTVLGFVPRLVIGSLVAYWVGEFANSFVLAKMKVKTQGKYLWTRTISSTIVGEGIDTVVVMVVAFYGVIPNSLLLTVAWNIYWVKVAYEIVVTPVTYLIVNHLKRVEGVDIYDSTTNFNPFRIGIKS